MKNPFIPAAELNFDAYKESLKEYLRTQHNFTDYDFEGSNISVLIDLLTYNTYNNALYLNMVGSEAWVDSSQLRASMVSHAKDLNYVPRSMSSAHCTITIEIIPSDNPSIITIPAYYKFRTSNSNGEVLYFVTDRDIVISRDEDGRYIARDITVYEGSIVEEFYTVDDVTELNGYYTYAQDFVIASENIDISSLEVFVNDNPYTRALNLFGVTDLDSIFFVTGWMENQYRVEFGDGVFGLNLNLNDTIKLRYRNTKGDQVYGNYILTKTSDIQGYSDITVSNISRATGGGSRESIESIRYSAPRYFQTQERAVVPQDYEILIKNQFPFIQDIYVFGGEEVYQYGKMMIVIKPYGHAGNISNNLKDQIINFVKTKNKITEPIIIDPAFFYLGIAGNIAYSSGDINQIRADVYNDLISLQDDELSGFGVKIYQSKINDVITNANANIIGSDIDLRLIKRWVPERGNIQSFTFTCDNEITSSKQGPYSSTDYYGISTNNFLIWHESEPTLVTARDDGVGNIHLYIINQDNTLLRIPNTTIGSVDYKSGTVNINLAVYDYFNAIEFNIIPISDIVNITRDKFILLDTQYFNFNIGRE